MTTIFLVRHAEHAKQREALLGRGSDPGLSTTGLQQMRNAAGSLAYEHVAAVQSSPRRRALITAQAIADLFGLTVEIVPALDELDYGQWSGLTFQALEQDPRWKQWNEERATAAPPEGESMTALRDRMLSHLSTVFRTYTQESVVLVSHAEPIRAVLLHASNISLNAFTTVEVPPGSITQLRLSASPYEMGCRPSESIRVACE